MNINLSSLINEDNKNTERYYIYLDEKNNKDILEYIKTDIEQQINKFVADYKKQFPQNELKINPKQKDKMIKQYANNLLRIGFIADKKEKKQ